MENEVVLQGKYYLGKHSLGVGRAYKLVDLGGCSFLSYLYGI